MIRKMLVLCIFYLFTLWRATDCGLEEEKRELTYSGPCFVSRSWFLG